MRVLQPVVTVFTFCAMFAMVSEMLTADEKPAPGRQVEQALRAEGKEAPVAEYLLFLPEGYGESDKKWPLMLFLHGRGESYGPLGLVKKWGPPRLVESNPKFPYILVSPQCPGKESWKDARQQEILVDLLNEIEGKYKVDRSRVYLTGLSMGGYGSWTLAAKHPERFAAVAPICGGGDPADAEKLKKLPIWVFHGDQDTAVPLRRSVEMVEAIRQAGGDKIRFTTLEHVGHNSWSSAYACPELYEWLDKQIRPEAAKSQSPNNKSQTNRNDQECQ